MPSIPELIIYIFSFLALYIQVFLLVTFLERRKDIVIRKKPITLSRYPSVTVIVPCYNEENTLYKTVRSLLALEYPKSKLKIILVDDGSTDGTWSIIRRFMKHSQIDGVQKENGGKHTAMNLGIEMSTSELIGGLDADSFVHPEALKRIVTYFDNPETMAVAPSILVHEPKNMLQWAQKAEYDMAIYTKKMLGFLKAIHVTPGPFSIFRKKVFDDLGLYRKAHNTEDQEIALRMHKHGYQIEHCPDAYVYTVSPFNVPALYKQRLRWTYGFIKNGADYRELLFRKKYGNLAFFTMPSGAISLLSVTALAVLLLESLFVFVKHTVIQIQAVGFHMPQFFAHTNWFYFTLSTNMIIFAILYSFVILSLSIGSSMRGGKLMPSIEVVYFIFAYTFLSPVWFLKAMYNATLSKESSWTSERQVGRVL